MSLNTIREIEQAIGSLSPADLEELCAWFDEYQHPLDRRMQADLSSGRLDGAIQKALLDEQNGRTEKL